MKLDSIILAMLFIATPFSFAQAQSKHETRNTKHETPLCEAAKTNRTIEMVYDKDVSKGCLPRLIDVHQVAIGNTVVAPRGVIMLPNGYSDLTRSNQLK